MRLPSEIARSTRPPARDALSLQRTDAGGGLSIPARGVLALLAAAAFGFSTYLAWLSFTGGTVAGCDASGAFDCDHVLTSRWSTWLGLPIALPAAMVYATVLGVVWFLGPNVPAAVRRAAWWITLALSGIAALAGLWFLGLQLFAIGSFCWPCVATHTCGIVLAAAVWTRGHFASRREQLPSTRSAMLAGVASISLLATLVVGQLAHEPDMYRIDSADAPPVASGSESDTGESQTPEKIESQRTPNGTAQPAVELAHSTQKPALSRIVKLHKTKTTFDAYEHPVLGSPDAEHVVVKLFDYGCHHCREQHFQLEEARKLLGSRLAVLVLPVPMNRSCNAFAPVVTSGPQMQSCVYARSALAVWRTDRTKFADFHHWLFEPEKPRSSDEVRTHVQEIAGAAAVALADNSLDVRKQIEEYAKLYDALGRGKIPKLVGPTFLVDGRFRDGKQLAEVLEGQWQRAAK
jgi:uncharacterized membrane protein